MGYLNCLIFIKIKKDKVLPLPLSFVNLSQLIQGLRSRPLFQFQFQRQFQFQLTNLTQLVFLVINVLILIVPTLTVLSPNVQPQIQLLF
jgi:hypothetical protein